MPRDDAIYELAQKDQRIFFPGGHAGRQQALALALPDGFRAEWNERRFPDDQRPRGFCSVQEPGGEFVTNLPERWLTRPVADAWERLQRIDPELLGRLPLPTRLDEALAFASATREMRIAEGLVREALSRALLFGVRAGSTLSWKVTGLERDAAPLRDAFIPLEKAGIDALGYGAWSSLGHPADKVFSFTRYGTDIPALLRWAHADYALALRFDGAKRQGVPAFVVTDNPFEPLLRIALLGLSVVSVTVSGVVLGCHVR